MLKTDRLNRYFICYSSNEYQALNKGYSRILGVYPLLNRFERKQYSYTPMVLMAQVIALKTHLSSVCLNPLPPPRTVCFSSVPSIYHAPFAVLQNGTRGNVCEVNGGQCPCKANFEGQNCDRCAPGFFNFPTCERESVRPSSCVLCCSMVIL